jgi:hypothetical protein
VERPIEGPEPYSPRLTSNDAGQWIGGAGGKAFDALMANYLPTVQPVYVGKTKLWLWMDVATLAYVMARSGAAGEKIRDSGQDGSE